MLKAAGVESLDSDLWWMPVTRPYNPNAKRIAEMMQADLAKVGVNVKLVSYEWGEYRKRLQGGEHQMGQLGWTGDNGDPDNFFFLRGCDAARVGGQNVSKWCNKEFDELLKKARTTADVAARTEMYKKMQEIMYEEAPDFLIAHSVVYEPIRKNVTGYKVSPLGRHEFYGVDLQ
jgi:dipeptide transport system substrate-binding protein